jgi:alkyl sulfatase BDS1-like metallo-beta-lactamase superfamily hydrolase
MAIYTSARASNEALLTAPPFGNHEDFEDAQRGLIDTLSPAVVKNTEGRIVWDMEAYSFLDAECPATVNPSAWRQAQLNAIHGLFEVADGIASRAPTTLDDRHVREVEAPDLQPSSSDSAR